MLSVATAGFTGFVVLLLCLWNLWNLDTLIPNLRFNRKRTPVSFWTLYVIVALLALERLLTGVFAWFLMTTEY